MERWEGKTAVVTGASGGIGREIVKDFVSRGINVVAIARQIKLLEGLKEDFSAYQGKVTPLKVDLNDSNEISEAFKWIEKKVGPVHILVNNAAVTFMRETLDFKWDEWRTQFNVNVMAPALCIQHLISSVERNNIKEAHIINISSIAAHIYLPVPGFCIYTATKTCLKTITNGIKKELVTKYPQINISNVSPGYVTATDLFRQHAENYPEYANRRDEIHSGLLPSEVSNVVMSVLSNKQSVRIDDVIFQSSKEASY